MVAVGVKPTVRMELEQPCQEQAAEQLYKRADPQQECETRNNNDLADKARNSMDFVWVRKFRRSHSSHDSGTRLGRSFSRAMKGLRRKRGGVALGIVFTNNLSSTSENLRNESFEDYRYMVHLRD